jgi:hypothetical protein
VFLASGQAPALIAPQLPTAAQLHRLDQLRASEEWRSASIGDAQAVAQRPIFQSVPRAAASASREFQCGDAGIGAASVLVLLSLGAGVVSVLRRGRLHRPVVG